MISGNKVRRALLTLHNWMGLFVGIQIIFWFVGGLVMTIIPLDLVRGEVNMADDATVSIPASDLSTVLTAIGTENLNAVSVRDVAGEKVIQVSRSVGSSQIYNSITGELLSPIGAEVAEKVALSDFQYRSQENLQTQITVVSSKLLTEEPGDFRRALPVWQITLNDPDGTRLYVSPDTGRVLARRNDYWRVFDFFWMLHIMDYENREDFNNPLLIITTLTSTLFVFTGVVLLYFRFRPRRKRR